ncbi:hypothetical protein NDU88_007374 [Pleurodeles waltl]|uniref:Uncharacterized protein n=1 Tax=Pleurodeles waltl TaxID=8319 RepID=A0AAV7RST3_PLEWA|nr:hypothetical protein NDU88_007374 [Pleurodeles waltl]
MGICIQPGFVGLARHGYSACCAGPQRGSLVPTPQSTPGPPASQGARRPREKGWAGSQTSSAAVPGKRRLRVRESLVLAGGYRVTAAVLFRGLSHLGSLRLEREPGLFICPQVDSCRRRFMGHAPLACVGPTRASKTKQVEPLVPGLLTLRLRRNEA